MNADNKILNILAGIALLLPFGQANALMLDNWNDTDLDASGDYIDVVFGDTGTYDWFSVQWVAGADNELQALGIDTIFYNCDGCTLSNQKDDDTATFGGVFEVYTGATAGALTNDITGDWETNFGGEEGGGGFGSFTSRKNQEGGGTDGITNWITFLLIDDGLLPFVTNGQGATMDAHVRYEEDCSGWASDGTSKEQTSGSCGTAPEPTPLVLLAMGLAVIGLGRRLALRRKT